MASDSGSLYCGYSLNNFSSFAICFEDGKWRYVKCIVSSAIFEIDCNRFVVISFCVSKYFVWKINIRFKMDIGKKNRTESSTWRDYPTEAAFLFVVQCLSIKLRVLAEWAISLPFLYQKSVCASVLSFLTVGQVKWNWMQRSGEWGRWELPTEFGGEGWGKEPLERPRRRW